MLLWSHKVKSQGDEMTAISSTAAPASDLPERIEKLIWAAMAPRGHQPGRTIRAATLKVADDLEAEAAAKGWTAEHAAMVGVIAAQVGARIARDAIRRGIVTREQVLNS